MQEFITIPTYLIKELPQDKLYALLDILSMADENGEFYSTTRKLMDRWKWGSGKTALFLKELGGRNIIETQTEHKRNTLIRINKEFLEIVRNTNGTQTEHKRSEKKGISIETKEAIQKISRAWNGLLEYEINPIPEMGITSIQYQNIIILSKEYGVEDILDTIERIKISDFLQGKVTSWKISFDWFLKIGNYKKVRSGQYDGSGRKKTNKESIAEQKQEDEELIGDEWIDL